MRAFVFAGRNAKEILRDPLCYIFCLGFPIVLLLLFCIINHYTAGNTPYFDIEQITPSIMIFSYSFVMLQMALLVSKDRTTSFLARLCTSPMTSADFIAGYALPAIAIAVGQSAVCMAAGGIIGLLLGQPINLLRALFCMAAGLPSALLFVSAGILFGSLFSENAAPGMASLVITLSGVLGGVWMPLDIMGGFGTFCGFLPFYPAVKLCKAVFAGSFAPNGESFSYMSIVALYTVIFILPAVLLFFRKSKKDE